MSFNKIANLSPSNRLSVFLVKKNTETTLQKFSAFTEKGLKIEAEGRAAEILERIVNENRTYFISGEKHVADDVVYLPMYCEMSRLKPKGILREILVDVRYLISMQQTRIPVSSELSQERYYVNAVVVEVSQEKEKNLYEACPVEGCFGAKVQPLINDGNLTFFCRKCGSESSTCDLRLMPKINIVDPADALDGKADTLTVTVFKENAEKLLEESENEASAILEMGDVYFANMFNQGNGQQFIMRLRASIYAGKITYQVDELF